MSAAVIDLATAAERLRQREVLRREQAFIEACEAELDRQPVMALDELVRRANARIRERGRQ